MKIRALIGIVVIAGLSVLVSCGGGGGGSSSSSGNTDVPPTITASLISFQPYSSLGNIPNASVHVQDPSTNADITTAIVTINDKALTYNPASGHNAFEGNVVVVPGENVVLSVIIRQKSYTYATTQFTSYPTISTPVAGTWYANLANTINWTGGTPATNSVYNLAVLDAHDPNGDLVWPRNTNNVFQVLPTSDTGNSFLANNITPGDRFLLIGIVRGESIPGAGYNSKLLIGGFSAIPIAVNGASLQSITVTPTNPTMPWGTVQQFTATGTFADNSSADVTRQVIWTEGGFAAFLDPSSPGLVKAGYAGSSTISANLNQISGSTSVTVLPAKLLSLQVSPNNRSIVPGTKQHFSASGQYEDGYVRDITSSVGWISSDTNVAAISNTSGSNGQATAVSTGTTTVNATLGGISASTTLTVANRPSVSGNSVYLQSDTGDYVGGGSTYSFSDANAQFSYNVTGGHLWINTLNGDRAVSGGDFAVLNTLSQLQAGYYGNLTRYPFNDPAVGGLDWYMSSRGCNNLAGWFAIDNVTYSNGNLSGIDLRFEQHCENASPALYGWIHLGP